MAEHVFVDESKKRDYLLVAAALPETALPGARRALRALLRPGQRRLHMVKESGSRQRQVLGVIRELAPRVTVYRAVRDGRSDTLRRAACLMSLVAHSCEHGAASITLEREDSAEERDRHTIFQQLSRFAPQDRPHYRHVRPSEEILLAIPDAIAWMCARNSIARREIRSLIDQVHTA
jgi:hypothetical protein